MRLRIAQLKDHLEKSLAPVYLLSGDEPLQLIEAADAVRARARALGYTERQVLDAGPGFEWGLLRAASDNLSLFADKRLIDLRLPGKPAAAGGKTLTAYAESPPPDTVLLVQTGKLDKGAASSAWVRALERAGVLLQVWSLSSSGTEAWIAARLRARGLEPEPQAARLLAERVEGNLLAGAQEIDKLVLLCGPGRINAEAVLAAVADSARFTIYDLADAALAGDIRRAVHCLRGLRAEGVEPVLVLWAIAREVRALADTAEALAGGKPAEAVLQTVWPTQRRSRVSQALRRGDAAHWKALLRRCAHADRVNKGRETGRPWDELLQLTVALAGQPLFAADRG